MRTRGEHQKPAYLIDNASEIRDEWLVDVQTILLTAGASAPEVVVQRRLDHLRARFGVTVDERTIRDEEVYFPLPRELRQLQRA